VLNFYSLTFSRPTDSTWVVKIPGISCFSQPQNGEFIDIPTLTQFGDPSGYFGRIPPIISWLSNGGQISLWTQPGIILIVYPLHLMTSQILSYLPWSPHCISCKSYSVPILANYSHDIPTIFFVNPSPLWPHVPQVTSNHEVPLKEKLHLRCEKRLNMKVGMKSTPLKNPVHSMSIDDIQIYSKGIRSIDTHTQNNLVSCITGYLMWI